ncbi:MAG: hypothetical protein QM817_10210 [Archangium sp.]
MTPAGIEPAAFGLGSRGKRSNQPKSLSRTPRKTPQSTAQRHDGATTKPAPVVVGISFARFDGGCSCIAQRIGRAVFLFIAPGLSLAEFTARAAETVASCNADAVFVDQSSLGVGVRDGLRQRGVDARGVDLFVDRVGLRKRLISWSGVGGTIPSEYETVASVRDALLVTFTGRGG